MSDRVIIPMSVYACRLKSALAVPAISPDYRTALQSYLGKDSQPDAFNTNILLKEGVHLHFILPDALRQGRECVDENGRKYLEYPAVPDRYIVTRTYLLDHKIRMKCDVVESSFYSLDAAYKDSITIPRFEDLRMHKRFRCLGRTYSAEGVPPDRKGEYGYLERLTAIGAGDPLFCVYYPACSTVFGFYDDLKGVPEDAVLTYYVVGVYSRPENDLFYGVSCESEMQKVLKEYGLSVEDGTKVCDHSVLFGVAGGVDLSKESPPPTGEIHVGIGRTSAEALSAIIKGCYYPQEEIERFLNSLQYGTLGEGGQPDGNFRIDDDIHDRGFIKLDPLETSYQLRLSPEEQHPVSADLLYKIEASAKKLAALRRILEHKKRTLYYLWEGYMDDKVREEELAPLMTEIGQLRSKIAALKQEQQSDRKLAESKMEKSSIEEISAEPFYQPGDPVVMLFGSGMHRSYAFGENGRFTPDGSLLCLTGRLRTERPVEEVLAYYDGIGRYLSACEDYEDYAAMAVLLDTVNLLPGLGETFEILDKYSPVVYTAKPQEQITLLLQWRTSFYPDYESADFSKSSFEYGDTEYVYHGNASDTPVECDGISVLTPHGVYNLQDQVEEYIKQHPKDDRLRKLAEGIRDLGAVSQTLGGFQARLSGLKHTVQFPIGIDPKDPVSAQVEQCLNDENLYVYEPPMERLAVRNNAAIYPLREGGFALKELALVSTFGEQRLLLDDEMEFRGKRYYSECVAPVKGGRCSLPLAVSSPMRLNAQFCTAKSGRSAGTVPWETAVIGMVLPDLLNRNLNLFSNSGEWIGTLRTTWRVKGAEKVAVGRFTRAPGYDKMPDERIQKFVNAVTKNEAAFCELMETVDVCLQKTLPPGKLLTGRVLVLAELAASLEFYGAPEWSKKDADLGKYEDAGLAEQKFPLYFGDRERVTDGVCCGFYDDFSRCFAPFGVEQGKSWMSGPPVSLSSKDGAVVVTLLFDPLLEVTVNSGILPVRRIRLDETETDFSMEQLFSTEMNLLLSDEHIISLPEFAKDVKFERLYPDREGDKVTWHSLSIVGPDAAVERLEGRAITDGVLTQKKADRAVSDPPSAEGRAITDGMLTQKRVERLITYGRDHGTYA